MKICIFFCICLSLLLTTIKSEIDVNVPIVITTWNFTNATAKAWDVVYIQKRSALDAVEQGCSVCEKEQCDGTVGYGGSPDEDSETTLDAMIMDGATMNIGAVGALRNIKSVISVARRVLENTEHTMLVGELATRFAVQMGFPLESLSTDTSKNMWKDWKKNQCQPNFWTQVHPDPTTQCGPYSPGPMDHSNAIPRWNLSHGFGARNHDTIGMIVFDSNHNMAGGTSTNGARHKIPGRVGDSPIPGSGAYVDNEVGGAAATGDGDVMMRFLPSFLAVEEMRRGRSPEEAGQIAMRRIGKHYPHFMGGIVAVNKHGEFGAACHGLGEFPYTVATPSSKEAETHTVPCVTDGTEIINAKIK